MHAYDSRSGVIFFSQVATNAIACWNTAKPLTKSNIAIIARDDSLMIYPGDITVRNGCFNIYHFINSRFCSQIDNDGMIYVMTNALPLFNYARVNPENYNYRVWRRLAADAIHGTACDASSLTYPH